MYQFKLLRRDVTVRSLKAKDIKNNKTI